MKEMRLAVLPGDGIGPEVTDAALRVLDVVADQFGLAIDSERYPIGYAGFEASGHPLPPATRQAVLRADAVFLGAVGDPRSDTLPPYLRPEAGLLELRKVLDCFANLRPAKAVEAILGASPLREDRIRGMDFLIVRELSSGLYYGEPRSIDRTGSEAVAVNTLRYTAGEIRRVAKVAFESARKRRRQLVSVDKANVLETSRLWREVVNEVAADFPDVSVEHMLVDRASMELVLRPAVFDVILTENLFGDILSDEAGAVTGSIGLLASASLGTRAGLFEPVHGSAPDIAGKDIANPIAAILSMAMLLEHSAGEVEAARAIESAVDAILLDGVRPPDLAAAGERGAGTLEVADRIVAKLAQ
jgi:3-isopropylmalate dehydrogenase